VRLARRFGPEVAGWCAGLPALAADLAGRWGLRLGRAWPKGGTSVVLPCESDDGEPLVLKLTPDPEIAADEAAALDAWMACRRVVTLHDADLDRGAELPHVFRTGDLRLIHAAACPFRYSSRSIMQNSRPPLCRVAARPRARRRQALPATSTARLLSPDRGLTCAVAVAIATVMRELRALPHSSDCAVDATEGRRGDSFA
jgi:hypothetical protein